MKRKLLALALCLALCVSLPGIRVRAAVTWGEPIDSVSALLAPGTTLKANTYWTDGSYRAEHYVELVPGGEVRPMVASHEVLCTGASLQSTAAALEKMGLHTVAGVNGGFYTVANRVPVGIVAADGILRSWNAGDAWMTALGFTAGGEAVHGKPGVSLRLTAGETNLELAALNQVRGSGLSLFTEDFAASGTKAGGDGWNIFCVPGERRSLSGELTVSTNHSGSPRTGVPLSGELTLTVERIEAAEGNLPVPEGRMVLSLAGDTAEAAPAWLAALSAGDKLILRTECAPEWEKVDSALGILYPLVEERKPVSGLETANAPRTAVGLRADGSLILYTVDGRQTGYSVGAGLDAVALRMIELGCVWAGALDGGGSTNLSAVLPGDGDLSQVNSPSDYTGAREVVNYLLLTTAAKPTGTAARLALYPLDLDAMTGAEAELTVKAVDAHGYPAPVPESVSFTVTEGLGAVEEGVFRAEGPGSGVITVSAPGLESASIPVDLVAEPEEIALYGEVYGRHTTALTLEPGQEVDLTVRARANHIELLTADEAFTWELEAAAGTVDETGHLVPGEASGKGDLTVSAGECREVIPITIWTGVPFSDVPVTAERFPAVKYVYEHQLFNGTGATVFDPDTVMNRAMLVTVLWRMNGAPAPETRPDFRDVEAESWYGDAVAWAAGQGLVQGYSPERFGPEDGLTREQIITILWRYAGMPEPEAGLSDSHPDARDVSPYALAPMAWGEALGLLLQEEDGSLLPGSPMPRADVAEVLMRYLTREA